MVEYVSYRGLQIALRSIFAPAPRTIRRNSNSQIEHLEERALLTNMAPVATPAIVTTLEDKPLTGQLAGTDAESDPLTFAAGALVPAHGKVVINADGTYTYTPAINYHGNDSFSFVANDGTLDSAQATVNITVTSVNDPPTVINGSASPQEDLAYPGTVATLASDVDADTLTYSVVTAPTHGTLTLTSAGTFTYTPVANYNGPDVFTFKANDSHADSNIGTFNLNISPVDDPLTLTLPSATTQLARNSAPVRLDPASTIADIDTVVNYANAQFRVTIFSGNTNGDFSFGRVSLVLPSQGQGAGLVYVKGSKIYYDGSSTPVGTVTGGTLGHALVVTFSKAATAEAANAVLKQISLVSSKKGSVGLRTINYTISAGGQQAFGSKSAMVN
jgi:VCBS repeat-containing protein